MSYPFCLSTSRCCVVPIYRGGGVIEEDIMMSFYRPSVSCHLLQPPMVSTFLPFLPPNAPITHSGVFPMLTPWSKVNLVRGFLPAYTTAACLYFFGVSPSLHGGAKRGQNIVPSLGVARQLLSIGAASASRSSKKCSFRDVRWWSLCGCWCVPWWALLSSSKWWKARIDKDSLLYHARSNAKPTGDMYLEMYLYMLYP